MLLSTLQNIALVFVIVWMELQLARGEVVHLIGFSINFRNPDMQQRVEYQCYRSRIDLDATIEFGRYISTRSNETDLPLSVSHSKDQEHIKAIKFKDEMREMAYGVFYCHGAKEGRDPTTVLSFFIRSDAKFIPTADAFTRTVSIGQSGIEIAMTVVKPPDLPGSITRWRFNGSESIESQNNRTTYLIDRPVTVQDQGIYEIYYEGERDQARAGFFRLVVRACPPNRWGLPDCEGVCDKCYNGGVCDDKSGLCICPNGFTGPNCLTMCRVGGGNRFGHNCEYRCSYKNDRSYQCRGVLFCLPDPYGCSCDIGSKGLSCTVACFDGEFGAGCTQRCHCASEQCGIYTGECLGEPLGCAAGWSGQNCQIPDVCDEDYYGEDCTLKCHCLNDAPCDRETGECPNGLCARNYATYDGSHECQACKGLTYGFNCSQECHCEEEACDLKMGRCNGKCLKNWLLPDCVRGVTQLISNDKVNPGQPSNMTCYTSGKPPPSADSISLSSDLGKSSRRSGIVMRSVTTSDSETVVVFDVEFVEEGEMFSCMLTEESQVATLEVGSSTYDLPVISKPLEVTSIETHEVTLKWDAWQPGVDGGDSPLIEYTVVYHNTTSTDVWMEAVNVTPFQNPTASVAGLRSDTAYEFAVAGVREGPGGMGLPGPPIRVTTRCKQPNIKSFNLMVLSSSSHKLELSWKKPSLNQARCRSGFQTFIISYFKRDSPDNETVVDINFEAPSRYTVTDLEVCTEYGFRIRASNKDFVSASSNTVYGRTTDKVPSPPDNLRVTDVTPSTVTIQWSILNSSYICMSIESYDILYRRTYPRPEKVGKVIKLDSSRWVIEYPIKGLWQNTNFSIQVRVISDAGKSPWSDAVSTQTLVYKRHHPGQRLVIASDQTSRPTEPPNSSDQTTRSSNLPGALTGVALGSILLVVVSMLVYRRRRRKV